jgi:hypothetical protein
MTDARPWYCADDVVDEYRDTLSNGEDDTLPMLKKLKLLRALVVNLGVVLIASLAILRGGDPTILGVLSVLVLGAYNGIEYSDYMALLQAYQEVQSDQ